MIKRIHVNQHIIKANAKENRTDDPLTIKVGRNNIKAQTVFVQGPSMLVYRPNKPLDCGAKVWIETTAVVHAYNKAGQLEEIA